MKNQETMSLLAIAILYLANFAHSSSPFPTYSKLSCNYQYTIRDGDTCDSIMITYFKNIWMKFKRYNGKRCSDFSIITGATICVPYIAPPPPPPSAIPSCGFYYVVKKGDTYGSLLYQYFERDSNLFKLYNGNSRKLQVGAWLCIPQNPEVSNVNAVSSDSVPITVPTNNTGGGLSTVTSGKWTRKGNKFSRFISLNYYVNDKGVSAWNYPLSLDWRDSDKVTDVKNQGNCSSCWAFAAISALESAYAIMNDVSASDVGFSAQQLIDCTDNKCEGGWPSDAFDYIGENYLFPANSYPYFGVLGSCKAQTFWSKLINGLKSGVLSMYETVNFEGWLGLLLAVQQQPVIVYLNGMHDTFRTYAGGIYSDPTCSEYILDHTLVVVGYNVESGSPYWILRNSWGEDWGEDGYMRMAITGGNGICGIHSTPGVYPVVKGNDLCESINPCGGGECDESEYGTYTCTCPSSFVQVTNRDGTQTCAPVKVCSSFLKNPCGAGTCMDDAKGSYYCICPSGFSSGRRVDDTETCIPSVLRKPGDSYQVREKDTCYLIASQFLITMDRLLLLNPGLNCNNLIVGSSLNVSSPSNSQGCSVSYAINMNDTCESIQSIFTLSSMNLSSLNPSLNCSSLIPGQQICVSSGQFDQHPTCTRFQTAYPGDTCQTIMDANGLNPTQFFSFNPGLYCDHLSVDSSPLTPGADVCVAANTLAACNCGTGNSYTVRPSDTCSRIIINYFGSSVPNFKAANCNMACTSNTIYVGLDLCLD